MALTPRVGVGRGRGEVVDVLLAVERERDGEDLAAAVRERPVVEDQPTRDSLPESCLFLVMTTRLAQRNERRLRRKGNRTRDSILSPKQMFIYSICVGSR